mgnify:CR=1 FL=1
MLGALCAMSMMAQTTKVVKGAVIDKNGNPLPGAVVEATGGAETTTVDADGSFEMEVPLWLKSITAKYAGMADKKQKLRNGSNDNLVLKMTSAYPSGWFVSLVGGFNSNIHYYDERAYGRLGVMGGRLGNWGFYGKITPTLAHGADGIPAVTVGGIKHLTKGTYLFLGAGIAPKPEHYNDYGYDDYDGYDSAILFDLGVIVTIKSRFTITYGCTFGIDFDGIPEPGSLIGFGYLF